jgi:hypothetical protein
MSKAGSHGELRKKDGVTTEELESSRNEAKTLAIATDVLIPCAVVAGAISLYFSVRTIESPKGGGTTVRIGASPTVGPSGVSGASGAISGSF